MEGLSLFRAQEGRMEIGKGYISFLESEKERESKRFLCKMSRESEDESFDSTVVHTGLGSIYQSRGFWEIPYRADMARVV
jgi:hypothetical protein